jgi:hypothetical protein
VGGATCLDRGLIVHILILLVTSRLILSSVQGIWCGKARGQGTLVLDVEGTDGREKEDQKAFEGKSALFCLALTDVMMVNMWMHEVREEKADCCSSRCVLILLSWRPSADQAAQINRGNENPPLRTNPLANLLREFMPMLPMARRWGASTRQTSLSSRLCLRCTSGS